MGGGGEHENLLMQLPVRGMEDARQQCFIVLTSVNLRRAWELCETSFKATGTYVSVCVCLTPTRSPPCLSEDILG